MMSEVCARQVLSLQSNLVLSILARFSYATHMTITSCNIVRLDGAAWGAATLDLTHQKLVRQSFFGHPKSVT